MEILINPKLINKENFSKFGDMISTNNIKPINIVGNQHDILVFSVYVY